jgi:murein DD-endopeptidase MepM/ murein hydrolase activator NlpD
MTVEFGSVRVVAMKVSVLRHRGLKLSQGAAVLLLAGAAAGCSTGSSRLDGLMTASTPNQQVVRPSGDLNGQQMAAAQPVSPAPSAGQYSGTVSRGELAPPTQTAALQSAPAYESNNGGMAQQSTAANAPVSAPAGGRVTVQPGDTVYGLARRYGVSASSIMNANGMSPSDNLRSGSKIIIPGASGDTVVASAPAPSSGSLQAPGAKPVTAGGSYKVQPGDTLSRISRNTGASVNAIKQANGISDGSIRIGQKLTIPGGSGNTQVASAAPVATDTLTAPKTQPAAAAPKKPEQKSEQVAAYTPPKKTESVIQQSDEAAPDATGIGRMRWPVRGRVISQFGKGGGKASDGIDISVPEGTPVKAAENGVVIYAGDGLKEFGNTVLVRHEDGLVTVYGHASDLKVQRGDKVKRGQDIAVSGMSGQTDAPKLHFEVRKNSAPVDPSTYLE